MDTDVFFLNRVVLFLINIPFSFRWTQSSHFPGHTVSSEMSARSLVEFCELVDFLLDIVSLVGNLWLHLHVLDN